MAISYVGVGTQSASSGGGATLTPTIPADLANNDILIVVVVEGTSDTIFTWPADYVEAVIQDK